MSVSNSFFYKIKNETVTIGYLFGTIHAAPKGMVTLSEMTKKAITKSSLVAFELHGQESQKALTQMISEKIAKEPTFITALCTSAMANRELHIKDKYGHECQIQDFAPSKPFIGLETAADQLDSLSSLERNSDLQTVKKSQTALLKAYEQGNKDAIISEVHAVTKTHFDQVITKRNFNMAEKACQLLHKADLPRLFIAVGVAHLIGPSGIVSLLQERGFTVISR